MSESQNIEYKSSWHDDYLDWIYGFAMMRWAEKSTLAKTIKSCKKFLLCGQSFSRKSKMRYLPVGHLYQ